jgi:hypothetical protein
MSSVTRTAIAATGPASTGRATLPIALSDCHFPADCEDESCLPSLTQTPNGDDNSAFTGFFDNASGNVLESYIHPDCGGGGLDGPLVSVGEHISLNNGQVSNFMQGFECQVCELGITEYVVPIITHCDENFVSASPPGSGGSGNGLVYGFASITVDSFNYSNGCTGCCQGGAPQTVNLHAVIRRSSRWSISAGVSCAALASGCWPPRWPRSHPRTNRWPFRSSGHLPCTGRATNVGAPTGARSGTDPVQAPAIPRIGWHSGGDRHLRQFLHLR